MGYSPSEANLPRPLSLTCPSRLIDSTQPNNGRSGASKAKAAVEPPAALRVEIATANAQCRTTKTRKPLVREASIFVEVSKRSEEPILEPHRVNRILVRP